MVLKGLRPPCDDVAPKPFAVAENVRAGGWSFGVSDCEVERESLLVLQDAVSRGAQDARGLGGRRTWSGASRGSLCYPLGQGHEKGRRAAGGTLSGARWDKRANKRQSRATEVEMYGDRWCAGMCVRRCWSLGLCEYGSVWADGVFGDAGLWKCRVQGAGKCGRWRGVWCWAMAMAMIIAVFKKTCEKNGLCSAWLALLPRLPAAEGRCVRARQRLQISRERWPHCLFYTAFYSKPATARTIQLSCRLRSWPRLSHSSFKTIITRAAFVATHDAVMTYKQGHFFFVTCLRVWGSETNTPADT